MGWKAGPSHLEDEVCGEHRTPAVWAGYPDRSVGEGRSSLQQRHQKTSPSSFTVLLTANPHSSEQRYLNSSPASLFILFPHRSRVLLSKQRCIFKSWLIYFLILLLKDKLMETLPMRIVINERTGIRIPSYNSTPKQRNLTFLLTCTIWLSIEAHFPLRLFEMLKISHVPPSYLYKSIGIWEPQAVSIVKDSQLCIWWFECYLYIEWLKLVASSQDIRDNRRR